MRNDENLPVSQSHSAASSLPPAKKKWSVLLPAPLSNHHAAEETQSYQAELFYLQKQIQLRTPMAFVLEDGQSIEGCIEWYDRNSIKIRGRSRILIYKAAIKYMYKLGE
jgi:sRNA-binding regulator protein Hfq